MRTAFLAALTLASASAFAPVSQYPASISKTSLLATKDGDRSVVDTARRQVLEKTLAAGAAFLAAPQLANAEAISKDAWAVSIQDSTNSLSTSLGHAFTVIDGLNTQARRLGSSPDPAHPLAVLDGMNAQARRLTSDLDKSVGILNTIRNQAKDIAIADEEFRDIMGSVAHSTSVLDGLVTQSKRLVAASSPGGSSTYQMEHMLSVLDGLNAQARRLNINETFSLLDELIANAEKQAATQV